VWTKREGVLQERAENKKKCCYSLLMLTVLGCSKQGANTIIWYEKVSSWTICPAPRPNSCEFFVLFPSRPARGTASSGTDLFCIALASVSWFRRDFFAERQKNRFSSYQFYSSQFPKFSICCVQSRAREIKKNVSKPRKRIQTLHFWEWVREKFLSWEKPTKMALTLVFAGPGLWSFAQTLWTGFVKT
jgi:hypothetical protein